MDRALIRRSRHEQKHAVAKRVAETLHPRKVLGQCHPDLRIRDRGGVDILHETKRRCLLFETPDVARAQDHGLKARREKQVPPTRKRGHLAGSVDARGFVVPSRRGIRGRHHLDKQSQSACLQHAANFSQHNGNIREYKDRFADHGVK